MSLTVEEARDVVFGVVDAAWKASGAATELVPLHFEGVKGDKPDGGTTAGAVDPYGRASVRIIGSGQSTQGRQRRYLTAGLLTVQVFTAPGDGYASADQFARVVASALRDHAGTPDGVWFFDVQALELGRSGAYLQVNVEAGFRFQETGP